MTSSVPSIEQIGHAIQGPHLHHLRQTIAQLLHRTSTHFPGAQPISFSRKHLQALKTRDYFLCEKSDGIRCLLFLTHDPMRAPDGAPTAQYEEAHYLIDRKNNYYRVPGLHFPQWGADRINADGSKNKEALPDWPSYHIDTLLDGEIVWDYDQLPDTEGGADTTKAEQEAALAKQSQADVSSAQIVTDSQGHERRRVLKYLVFDTLLLHGSPTLKQPLDKRLAYFHDQILSPYEKLWEKFPVDCLTGFPFRLERKSTQRAYGTEMMFKSVIPELKHGSDGLIFTCRETPYVCGTDENILKWKPAEENSIDFKLDLNFPPVSGRKRKREGSEETQPNGNIHSDPALDSEDDDTPDYEAIPTARLLIYSPSNTKPNDPDAYFAHLHLPASDWDHMKSHALKHQTGLDGAIVECHRDSTGNWRFNRFRDDKSEANHVSVAEKVLESIEDAVERRELVEVGYEVRKAWKAREAEVEQRKRREGR